MDPVRDIPPWKVLPSPRLTMVDFHERYFAYVVKPGDADPPTERVPTPVVRPTEPVR